VTSSFSKKGLKIVLNLKTVSATRKSRSRFCIVSITIWRMKQKSMNWSNKTCTVFWAGGEESLASRSLLN